MTENSFKSENPFNVGLPANPKDFIGREELLEELLNDMKKGDNISLCSERRTGKSSLLKYIADIEFASRFDLPENHIFVYIDFQIFGIDRKTELSNIWKAIANAIAYKLLEDNNSKIAQLFTNISTTIEKEPMVSIGTEFEKAFNKLVKENYKFHLLFDEFESTSQIPSEKRKAFYDVLRSLPTRTERNVSYIIATRTGVMSLEDNRDKYSSLFSNIFSKTIYLRPFQQDEVKGMIYKYLPEPFAEKVYAQDSFLYQISGYHPLFLNKICSLLYENMDKPDFFDKEMQDSVFDKFKKFVIEHLRFYWKLSPREEKEIMKRLAAGLGIDSSQNKALIDKLKDRSLVIEDREDKKPRLFSSVFKDWICDEYPIKSQEFTEEILHIGKDYLGIKITQDHLELFVHKETGEILGPQREGTLGIVLYAGKPGTKKSKITKLEVQRAIRIPRLLQSDMLLNYHIAEISFYEGQQAHRYGVDKYLSGAIFFQNLTEPTNNFIPGDSSRTPCYIGFYLSPGSRYKICLLSEYNAWPPDFATYVKDRYTDIQKLHSIIKNSLWDFKSNKMGQIVFLPYSELNEEYLQKDESEEADHPIFLDRDNLNRLYSENKATGWWFNLPIAGYYWLSADLQGLLSAYLDEDKDNNDSSDNSLKDWKTESWLKLIQNLAGGLVYLHKNGGIHGDIRPANIMTDVDDNRKISPNDFKWIDVGLANDLTDALDSKKTLNMPRPLGEERKTPFYAPERNDIFECEDADEIRIGKEEEKIYLSFWSQRTVDDDFVPLKMQKDEKAIRELGGLREGDRIQVREFLFDIETVEENRILIKNVYELGFGRLLIQKKETELDMLIQRLNKASISRYKIYKQWSQATDIYGFGVLILYLFYIRGLHYYKFLETTEKSFVERQLKKERNFEEFIIVLNKQRFLKDFLSALDKHKIENTENVWRLDAEKNIKEELAQICQFIIELEPMMRTIYYGVGKSYRLFIQIVYTALCCLWRKEEIDNNLSGYTEHIFNPFCEHRLRSISEFEKSTKKLKTAIDLIVKHELRNAEYPDEAPDSLHQMDYSQQSNTSIMHLNTQLEALKNEKKKIENDIKKLEKELSEERVSFKNLKTQNEKLEKELSEKANSLKDLEIQNEKLEKELSEEQVRFKNLETQNQKLGKELSEKDNSFKNLETQNQKLRKELSEEQVRFKNLEAQNQKLRKELSEEQVRFKNLETQNQKLGKELSEKDNNFKNLKTKYEQITINYKRLQESINSLTIKNNDAEENIERLKTENTDLREQYDTLRNERNELFNQNKEISQKFESLRARLDKFREHKDSVKKDMEANRLFNFFNLYPKSNVDLFIDDIFNKAANLTDNTVKNSKLKN